MRKLSIVLLIIMLDQISKIGIIYNFSKNTDYLELGEYLNFVLVFNNGISFGMFNEFAYSSYLFSLISIVIVCFLLKWYKDSVILWENVALGCIIGGAIGNVADRIMYGAVVDFIQLHWKNYYWPSFNVADSAICFGVCVLMILNILNEKIGNKK